MFQIIAALAIGLSWANKSAPAKEFKWELDLRAAIENSQLDQMIPSELQACQGSDATKMWVEFMKGLAYIESGWDERKDNKCDLGCDHPSKGLFQMTGGNTALGRNCFGTTDKLSDAPFDPLSNIKCAVDKMKELLGKQSGTAVAGRSRRMTLASVGSSSASVSGSLVEDASKYWGPMKKDHEAHYKIEALITDITQNCGNVAFDPAVVDRAKGNTGTQSTPAAARK